AAAEAAVPTRRLAAATFPKGVLHRLEAQFRHNAATPVAVAVPAAKVVLPTETSKATLKLLTFMRTVIAGSVMRGAATMLVIIRTMYGNTDASAAKSAAATSIALKAEAATVSGSAAFTGTSRRTTTTTPTIGYGTATTS